MGKSDLETFFRVRLANGDASPFICSSADLPGMLAEETEPATVEPVQMTQEQYDRLPEFGGP